jgi:AAA domain
MTRIQEAFRNGIPEIQSMPQEPQDAKKAPRTLDSFIVSHADTLGMSWNEIDALRPPFVIDHFIRQGELMLLGAESKSRKSWLAQDAAFCVAAGMPWLADENGRNGFTTARASVHVVDLELNPSEMRFRFAKARGNRFADDAKGAAEVTERVHSYSLDGMNVTDTMPLLEELETRVQPGDLVILDCLYRLVPDGNEVAPLAAMLETLKRFAAGTQSGMILVDHFRKAGDEKARNRFAGSFVKQASASTLVAIEVSADDLLVMNIDARTFHGLPTVHAKFNLETYAFNRVPDEEIAAAKEAKRQADTYAWIVQIWKSRSLDYLASNLDAVEKWGGSRQGATKRFDRLQAAQLVERIEPPKGGAVTYKLTADGKEVVAKALQLHP